MERQLALITEASSNPLVDRELNDIRSEYRDRHRLDEVTLARVRNQMQAVREMYPQHFERESHAEPRSASTSPLATVKVREPGRGVPDHEFRPADRSARRLHAAPGNKASRSTTRRQRGIVSKDHANDQMVLSFEEPPGSVGSAA